jgi:hypothetical protein
VAPNGQIKFEFQRLDQRDVPDPVVRRHGADLVRWCFENNTLVPPQ